MSINDKTIEYLEQCVKDSREGKIIGLICLTFNSNNLLNLSVSGDQPLLMRLGALNVAADAMKLAETQRQLEIDKQLSALPQQKGEA